MDRWKFIDSLVLEDGHSWPALSSGKKQAFVDDGSLVSFTSKLTGQHKYDVLNSTLLAQLAANYKYNRFDDPENWYEFYTDVLGNVGWVLQNFYFEKYKSHQTDFKIAGVTLELLSGIIGGEAELMAVVTETLDSLAQSSEGITLFGSNSSSGKKGNFQILPCTVDGSNQVNVAFLGFHFEARQVDQNYFFFTYKKQDIKLFKSAQVFTLDEEVYSQVREQVVKKLGDNAKKFVDELPLQKEIKWFY